MRALCITIGLSLLIALPGEAQSRPEPVSFELRNRFLITVKGSAGELKNLCFALDTGANHTMLSRGIAEKLSLPHQPAKVLNFDREFEVEWTEISELQIGPLIARNLRVLIGDLKQFTEFADGVDGIIGQDVLRMSGRMRIDYGSRLIIFQFDEKSGAVDLQQPQIFVVRLPVQGQMLALIIDTGLEDMLLYADRLRKHVPDLKLRDLRTPAHAGRLVGEKATLPGIRIGREDAQATAMLLPSAPKSLPDYIDGYLGFAVLDAQMLELDFSRSTLSWQ